MYKGVLLFNSIPMKFSWMSICSKYRQLLHERAFSYTKRSSFSGTIKVCPGNLLFGLHYLDQSKAGSTAGSSCSHYRPHYSPGSRVQASSTYVVAPYGRMLCAMLASWHYPRANGQTLVTPPHGTEWLRLLWRRMACGCRVAMKKKKEGSQVSESNKSDKSQRSGLAVNLAFWCTVHIKKKKTRRC